MKKQVIAVMLSMMMAVGSVGTTPVWAAETEAIDTETTAQEATTEEAVDELSVSEEEEIPTEEISVVNNGQKSMDENDNIDAFIEDISEEWPVQENEKDASEENNNVQQDVIEDDTTIEDTEGVETKGSQDSTDFVDAPVKTDGAGIVEEEIDANSENEATGDVVTSGSCGESATWTLQNDILIISGSGEMEDYYSASGTPWYEIRNRIKKVEINTGVLSVGGYAFCECENLTELDLPEGLLTMGSHCITGTKIERLVIPSTVNSCSISTVPPFVGANGPFAGADHLKEVVFNNGMKTIPPALCASGMEYNEVYDSCIEKIEFPGNLEVIGYYAFNGCDDLEEIHLPRTVTDVGSYAFQDCSSLKKLYFYGDAPNFYDSCFGNVEATAYYPKNNSTWNDSVRQDYGGTITWIAWDPVGGYANNIKSLVPQNGEKYTIPSLFEEGKHSYNNVYIEFADNVNITGEGSVYLCDYKTDEIIETIPLTEEYRANGFACVGKKLCLSFSKTVNKGEMYYITIDEGALMFTDPSTLQDLGIFFPGLKKGEWCFTIIGFEIPSFKNPVVKIDMFLYDCLFAPIWADFIKVLDDGSKGLCYGMGYTAQAWNKQWRGVVAATGQNSIEVTPIEADYTGFSYLHYIEWVHLSQYMPSESIECSINTDKFQKIYEAICADINGTGDPIMLGLQGGPDGGHAVLPVAILSDTDDKAEIIIYDPSEPFDIRTNTHTFYPTLTFTKTNNVVTGFTYLEYTKLNYNTFNNSADEGAYHFHLMEDTINNSVYKMVTSSTELLSNIQTGLYSIMPRNGNSADNDVFLYWTEDSSITTNESKSIGITDGYKQVSVEVDRDADITVDIDEQSADIMLSDEESGEYAITYSTVNVSESSNTVSQMESMEISGSSKSSISSRQTDEGVFIRSANGESLDDIFVNVSYDSETIYTIECSSAKDSLLITNGDSISVKEDADKDGEFETVIASVKKKDIGEKAQVTDIKDREYTGEEQTQEPIVIFEGKSLVLDIDYSVSYENNIDAGTASVIIAGTGIYGGRIKKTFRISPKKEAPDITLSPNTFIYNGKEQKPTVAVKVGEIELSVSDYTITWPSGCTDAGAYEVSIILTGNYSGSGEASFEISPKSLIPTIVLSKDAFTYTGEEQKPTVIVKDGDTVLADSDYEITWPTSCTNAGTYKVTITFEGNYSGSASTAFTINKAPQTVTAKPMKSEMGVNTSIYCTVSGIGWITYSSSDPSIVTVDSYGWLEGNRDGTALITVRASGDENHLSGETTFEIIVKGVYAVTSGPCGDNATWTYYNNGTIEINGTGTIELIEDSSGHYLWDRYYTPDSVWGYDKVDTVIINEGITGIGREVFSERSGYGYGHMSDSPVTVEIADSVKTISTRAFINCSKLERVSIGAGLTTIGECAFSYCPSLKEISVSEDNESFIVVDGALYSKDLKNLYKLPNDGRTSFTISEGTETIVMDAMGDLASLEKLTIPKSVKKIVEYALDGSNKLTDVYYEGSLSQWKMLVIGDHNDALEKANIHYAENEKTVEDCTATLSKTSYFYDGKEKKPEVTVTEGDTVLKEGVDYQLIYKDNIDAGTATVIITGMGSYIGKAEKTFKINPKKATPTIMLSPTSFTYNGKVQKPTVTVKDGNTELSTSDYTVTWPLGCTDVGTYWVSVSLKGNYSGSGTADYKITEKAITLGKTTRGDMFNLANNVKVTWKEVPGAKYYKVYRSGVKDPVIVTTGLVGWDKTAGLVNGQKYTYKIVASLTGKGDSSGDSPLSYSKVMYRLKTVVLRSVKNTAPGKVTVKYDKSTSGDSYVLQYCERQDMVGAKTKVVLGANNTSYTIGGLKKGKTYYISIRVRKKVNGIDYYTTFGVAKKITITK